MSTPSHAIDYQLVHAPIPERGRGWKTPAVASILESLTVAGPAADIGLAEGPMRDHIYRFRKAKGRGHRFVVRQLKPGWSRTWRIA